MTRFLVQVSVVILALCGNQQIFGMLSLCHDKKKPKEQIKFHKPVLKSHQLLCQPDVKLLECAEPVRGKSLLEQNNYFLPSDVLSSRKISALSNSISNCIGKGLSGSTISSDLPLELQRKIIELAAVDNPLLVKCVNKNLLQAITGLGIRNVVKIYYEVETAEYLKFLLTNYVPVIVYEDFVNDREGNFGITTPYCSGFRRKNFGTVFSCVTSSYMKESLSHLKTMFQNDQLCELVHHLGLRRMEEAFKGDLSHLIGVDNWCSAPAIVCGDMEKVLEDTNPKRCVYKSVYNDIIVAINYSDNARIIDHLVGLVRKDKNQLRDCFSKTNKNDFYRLLCLADQYNNNAVFDRLVSVDPYHLKNKFWKNDYGVDETILDIVLKKGTFRPENIEKLRKNGYSETVLGTVMGNVKQAAHSAPCIVM